MKMKFYSLFGALALVTCSCNNQKQDDQVISQRHIHKYGYAVSADEWNMNNYPGQVITALRSGVTITSSYENGVLHGPCTRTFPNSQIVESYTLYNQGTPVKEVSYDNKAMPVRERIQLSPTRHALTLWYDSGTPLSVEEYANDELLEGQYFTIHNEIEARVEKGHGKRVIRDQHGLLLAREEIKQGFVAKKETFYASGTPETVSYYVRGKLHGERSTFLETGEPLTIEEWVAGNLHGKSTYFKNGTRIAEVSYLNGLRNGVETQYLDGEKISQQIFWENDRKHGIATYFVDGEPQFEHYYAGELVSKKQYDEQMRMDEMISQISPELRVNR
ncbi:MAG: toxin-antitoxin system YwqK family antitoxin [Chlamydiales bacterium]|nr:toxin-antitoxin system YwqK family antitoxin [Chlamydiales bacterium]